MEFYLRWWTLKIYNFWNTDQLNLLCATLYKYRSFQKSRNIGSTNPESHNIFWMVLTWEKQANIRENFGRLHVNNTLTLTQESNIISYFGGLRVNWLASQLQNMAAVNFFLSPFKGNINPGYPRGLKLHLQKAKDIDK